MCSERPGQEGNLAAVPYGRALLGKAAAQVEADVAHGFARHDMHACRTGLGGMAGEGVDQARSQTLAAESGRQIDMQVRRIAPAQVAESGAEIADVGEALLFRGVLQGAYEIACNRAITAERHQHYVRAVLQISPEPALAEGLPLGARLERAAACLEEDALDLGELLMRQPAAGSHDNTEPMHRTLLPPHKPQRGTFPAFLADLTAVRWRPTRSYADFTYVSFITVYCIAMWHAIYHIAVRKRKDGRGQTPIRPLAEEMMMSTIKSFDEALDCFPGAGHRHTLTRFGKGLRTYWGALTEGLAAARRYHELTARGMPHDVAVQRIFNEHFHAR